MKKVQNKNRFGKIGVVLVVAALISLLVGYSVFAYSSSLWPFSTSETDTNNSSSENTSTDNSEPGITQEDAEKKQEFLDKQSTPDNSSSAEGNLQATVEQQGNSVIVKTSLTNIPSGNCKLVIKSGSETVTKEAEIMYSPDYSTCAGFSVSTTELPKGQWSLYLSVKNDVVNLTKDLQITVK